MKQLLHFVNHNRLQPGDVVVVAKSQGFFEHYVFYLGIDNASGWPVFMANMMPKGVTRIGHKNIHKFEDYLNPSRIRRFLGNATERQQLVAQIRKLEGQVGYNLLTNNCEHFANLMQHGIHYSQQTEVGGAAMVALGLTMAANSKSEGGKLFGFFIGLLGMALSLNETTKSVQGKIPPRYA